MNANEYPSAVETGAALVRPRAILSWLRRAGSIELASGEPAMAMGGSNGGDPTPTLAQFKALVAWAASVAGDAARPLWSLYQQVLSDLHRQP